MIKKVLFYRFLSNSNFKRKFSSLSIEKLFKRPFADQLTVRDIFSKEKEKKERGIERLSQSKFC
jgi:hypothetical protein